MYASSDRGAFNILLIASKHPEAANSASPSSSESSYPYDYLLQYF